MKLRRLLLVGIGTPVALALALIVAAPLIDRNAGEEKTAVLPVDSKLVARGKYLAQMGDCAACHSVPGQPAFSGGLRMNLPIGAIFTPNITPDAKEGIGDYSLEDFDRALRYGVSRGHSLYPAMPFPSYANTRPEDVEALYAYFRKGVEPSAVPNRKADIVFPLSMRWPLTYWRLAFAPRPTPFKESASGDATVAVGAYLVEGLGHCGECHTPRNFAMQVRAQTSSDGPLFLSGAPVENWFAPSLRGAGPGSLAGWNEDEIATFLSTGANHFGIAFGSMGDVVGNSMQHLSQPDALAIARYLKTLSDPDRRNTSTFDYDDATEQKLRSGDAEARGALGYLNNCATCHRPDGRGYAGVFPALAGNPVVESRNPLSLISIVLSGSMTTKTSAAPAQFHMPSFAWRLSDSEIADIISFIRASWGNRATPIDESDVKRQRVDVVTSYPRAAQR